MNDVSGLGLVRRELRDRWYRDGYYSTATISSVLRAAVADHPTARFVLAGEADSVEQTFADVVELGSRFAKGLRSNGIQPGDVVAVQVPNRVELLGAYFGTWLAGAVLVPITHIYGPAELGAILRDSRARALVVPDAWRSIDFIDRISRLTDVPDLALTVVIGSEAPVNCVRWADMVAGAQADAVITDIEAEVSADDVCAIVYTSGTTGVPKGVQHTHNSFLYELAKGDAINEMSSDDCRLIPWPSGHIAGLLAVCGALTTDIDTVLMDRWVPDRAVELIEQYRCTVTSGTPLHVQALLAAAEETGRDVSTLRFVQVGAANVPPSLVAAADASGLVVARAYGSTEHPRSATSPLDATARQRSMTDGKIRFGDEMRIVDAAFTALPIGSEGEIVTRGPSQFIGYRDSAADATAFTFDGWFRTGDIGRIDADGFLTVTDRLKDIIIRGGENIASKEVEDILITHPRVLNAAVVAESDEKYGERVAAFVVLTDDGPLDLDEVREFFSRAGAAPQKAPERIEVVDDLPRAPSGKVRKFELRDRLKGRACVSPAE